jgi:hypothetical protein
MGILRKVMLGATLLCLSGLALATTWASSKVKDPVSGRSIKVQEPMTSGSYIYSWPGKEDQVFWPLTDDAWLWFNPRTGYGAMGSDFSDLDGEALARVKAWLAANYDKAHPPVTRLEKLSWLEKIYEQRGMDEGFWSLWYRLMAFELAEADPARSLDYVRRVLPLLQKQLPDASGGERIPVLYLLGEYHRRLGDSEAAQGFFQQARQVSYKDRDGATQVGSDYFNELIAEREKLAPGERPAPVDR